ncbi:MAG: 23S rRNA (guanosine(2251)-2'-O)-methyltransferase RlmB [Rhodospirillaceae bacterium]|jgi:23S rRNA (guanosine2251-2'-O)-methyltransferase|nr:23S rRNA (guanosine(2251)-2'-O)-methyltransferase RlmB [Rhodospirillaceae bacterium]
MSHLYSISYTHSKTPNRLHSTIDNDKCSQSKQLGLNQKNRNSNKLLKSNTKLWLWGNHSVLAALANPKRKCLRFLLTIKSLRTNDLEISKIAKIKILPQIEIVENSYIENLLPLGAVHQGVALFVEPLKSTDIDNLINITNDLNEAIIICLDQVTDPHNIGAIIRSSVAFGALGLIIPCRHTPNETGFLAKSASGALELLPLVHVTNLIQSLTKLKHAGFWIAGLDRNASITLANAKLKGKIVLIFGNECAGLRRLTREHCDYLINIPQSKLVESLNVSVATAIALYELIRY